LAGISVRRIKPMSNLGEKEITDQCQEGA